ncbi:hypothetical protein Tco_1382814, partial [Tanacetum coccineum]
KTEGFSRNHGGGKQEIAGKMQRIPRTTILRHSPGMNQNTETVIIYIKYVVNEQNVKLLELQKDKFPKRLWFDRDMKQRRGIVHILFLPRSINDISNIRDADRGQSYRKKADIQNLEVPATSWRIGTSPPASGASTPFYDPDPDVGQR